MTTRSRAHTPAMYFDATTIAAAHERLARPGPAGLPSDADPHKDVRFASLREAYRASGGLADVNVLASRLEGCRRDGNWSLAQLIVLGKVFCFGWGPTFWVPMFQFEPGDLSVRPASCDVLSELIPAIDGRSIAAWFLEPQAELGGRSPLGALDADPAAVMRVARSQRMAMVR